MLGYFRHNSIIACDSRSIESAAFVEDGLFKAFKVDGAIFLKPIDNSEYKIKEYFKTGLM